MPYVSFLKPPRYNYVVIQKDRHWIRYEHIILGIAGLALLYAQIYLGFDYCKRMTEARKLAILTECFGRSGNSTSESRTNVPKSVIIIYWILLGLALAAYFLGWAVMEPLAHKKRAREMRDNPSPTMEQKRLVA
jgi:hypothetical protein